MQAMCKSLLDWKLTACKRKILGDSALEHHPMFKQKLIKVLHPCVPKTFSPVEIIITNNLISVRIHTHIECVLHLLWLVIIQHCFLSYLLNKALTWHSEIIINNLFQSFFSCLWDFIKASSGQYHWHLIHF